MDHFPLTYKDINMKVLSIGNSFSQDAQRYLHRISVAAEAPIKCVNLYIGGCSLRMHYFNVLENEKKYQFEFNGENTGIFVTVKEALMSDSWDYVTLQQVSVSSAHWDTYQPYLSELAAYVKRYAPQAKLLIHQTWAYDNGAPQRLENAGFSSAKEMYDAVRVTYKKAAEEINAHGIIPSGYTVNLAIQNGIACPYRDGYHLSAGAGRYLIGLLWFCYLTGKSPNGVPRIIPDQAVTDEEYAIIRKTVTTVIK
jgi:hypothetical protein